MGKHYTHLSLTEREEISIGVAKGHTLETIARKIGRHKSTVSREIARNRTACYHVHYRANIGQNRYEGTLKKCRQKERLSDPETKDYVIRKLKCWWSPERIAGRMPLDIRKTTNHESIYQWIYECRPDLKAYLPRSHRRRRRRGSARGKREPRVPDRIPITERPWEALSRLVAGHWEADTAISRQSKDAIAVMAERKTRLLIAVRIPAKTACQMKKAVCKSLKELPKKLRRTVTFDNGTENAMHKEIGKELQVKTFFCAPYHSWEKGTVENRIGIIRRFYKKKTDWKKVSQKELNEIIDKINSMPMKCLGWKTPKEAFQELIS